MATAYCITKCDRLLLQIATAFLLQSATQFITNCDRYYKVRWIYYKLRQVLQSAMIITNCDSTGSRKEHMHHFIWNENDQSSRQSVKGTKKLPNKFHKNEKKFFF